MRAAPPEGLVTGFVTGLRASVVEFSPETQRLSMTLPRIPGINSMRAKRNTILNRLYHHGVTPIVSGIAEYTTSALST